MTKIYLRFEALKIPTKVGSEQLTVATFVASLLETTCSSRDRQKRTENMLNNYHEMRRVCTRLSSQHLKLNKYKYIRLLRTNIQKNMLNASRQDILVLDHLFTASHRHTDGLPPISTLLARYMTSFHDADVIP